MGEMTDEQPAGHNRFWVPRTALAVYSGYIALLFSVGQYYPLFPWVLVGAVLVGALVLYTIARSVRAAPRSRPWFSNHNDTATGKRPGLGNLLLIILIGPVPFLLAATIQQWLLNVGWQAGWLLMVSTTAVFVLIFGGYCLVEAVLNRRAERWPMPTDHDRPSRT